MNGNYHYYNLRLFTHLFDISCRAQGGLSIPSLIHDRSDLYNCAYTQRDRWFTCKLVEMIFQRGTVHQCV